MLWLEFGQCNPGVSCLGFIDMIGCNTFAGLASLSFDKTRYLTFWRRFKSTWASILRFATPSGHGKCDECVDCKHAFRRAMEP